MGRRDEMAALEDEFARAAAGEFRVVLLLGEAGVGKSRLGRELLARHPEAAGMFGRAHPLGVTAAFGLWAEAIDPLLQGRSDRQIAAVCGGLLDDLASLFHRVAVVRGSLPDREPPLPRLLQGLAALARNLAAEAPVLAVLDDVHFADASSWEALRYFARHLDATRLLVVATSLPADLAEHEVAARALFELDEDGFLCRLGVAPLDRQATRELAETIIGRPPPAALVDWVGQRSRGNPLYVISLLRALLEERADLSAPSLRRLPEGLTERMAARTRSVDPGSQAVRVLLDAMRQAEQREAFRETLDLLSELVEILLATDPRWLGVLEAMYWQAEWVVDHRAETQAETAIRALRAIDGLLTRSADDARRATVKFRLANFLAWGTGELEGAEDACREAVRLFEAADDQRQALLAGRELGWIRGLRGDIAGMAAESARVVEAADALGDRFVAMQGLAALGYSTIMQARFAHGEAAIRRAAAIAREDEKSYRLTVVLSLLAARLALQGRTGESGPLFEQARSLNPAFRDAIVVELEAFVHWMAGDFTAAVAAARETVAWVPGGSGTWPAR